MMRRALLFLAAAMLMAVVVHIGLQVFLRHQVDGHLQSLITVSPVLENIDYDRLEIQLAPLGLVLREVTLKPSGTNAPITVRRATLSDYRPGHPLPQRFALALENVRIAATDPATAPWPAMRHQLGLEHLDGDLELRLEQNRAQANAWQGHLVLQVERVGILRIMLAVENLNIEGAIQALDNPVLWWTVLPPVGIRAAAAEFEDGGLVEGVVAARARRDAISPAAARLRLREAIATAARRERLIPLGQHLSEFIAAPVRIGYYSRNPAPVRLGRLMWARRFSDWSHALQIEGYRASAPRVQPWVVSTGSIPEKPPRH